MDNTYRAKGKNTKTLSLREDVFVFLSKDGSETFPPEIPPEYREPYACAFTRLLNDGRTPEQADMEAREFVKYAVRAEP